MSADSRRQVRRDGAPRPRRAPRPSEPGEPPSVRREPRRSIEIVPTREHVSGSAAGAEIDGDDGIDRFAVNGVILAYADPAATALVDHAIGETPLPLARGRIRRERLRFGRAW